VAEAAASILAQVGVDLELIVVDDGSTDGSPEVVRTLDDRRVRLHRRPHQGLVAALNEGLTRCCSPLIARMDADDRAHPERLVRQLDRMACGDVSIVGCQVRIVDRGGSPVSSMQRYERWINDHVDPEQIAALRFVESPLVHPTVLARREVFERGYRDGDFPEDYDLWLRALASGHRAAKVPAVLLDWVDSSDRLTRQGARYRATAFDCCRRMHLLAGPLAGVGGIDLWGAGQTGKLWLRWLQGCGITVRRLYDIDPRKLGQQIHGVEVRHPRAMPAADGTPLVAAVGAEGARPLIAEHVQAHGHVVGADVWFVA
jgi:hypothetical protein